jgi:hypothetical protein
MSYSTSAEFFALGILNRAFSRFAFLLLPLPPSPIMPRTILGQIDGNRGYQCELTPYQRGKIEDARSVGATFKVAAEQVNCAPLTARLTLKLAPERINGHSKKHTGRPKSYDIRFKRRVLRIARFNPKMTYKAIAEALDTLLSHDTLYRILKANGLTNWLTKKRPFLTLAAVKKRYTWALFHNDWSFEEWAIII